MPSAQSDFTLTLDRAAGLTLDALCSSRAAAYAPLPDPQGRHLRDAIVALQQAQDLLFRARNTPWQPQPSTAQLQIAATS